MEEDVDLRCNSLHPQTQVPDDPFHDRDSLYTSRDSTNHLITSISFYFNSCLKTTSIYYPEKTATPILLRRRVCLGRVDHKFHGVNRDFFFGFQEHEW